MMNWQDPVALALAVVLFGGTFWFRRWLIKRGAGGHCAQCTAGKDPEVLSKRAAKPTVIAVSQLRIGRRR